ncbi:13641_t:CDS:1, partial [Acaulospora colombiana]
ETALLNWIKLKPDDIITIIIITSNTLEKTTMLKKELLPTTTMERNDISLINTEAH